MQPGVQMMHGVESIVVAEIVEPFAREVACEIVTAVCIATIMLQQIQTHDAEFGVHVRQEAHDKPTLPILREDAHTVTAAAHSQGGAE